MVKEWEYWTSEQINSWINHKLKEVHWEYSYSKVMNYIPYGVNLDGKQTELIFHITGGFKFQCMVEKIGDTK